MNELHRLRQSLQGMLLADLQLPPVPTQLRTELTKLEQYLGSGGPGSRPPQDRMRKAVANFWQYQDFSNVGEARLTCFGAIERFELHQPALIDDASAFQRLLDAIDRYSSNPRSFRRCYRGLVDCYFSYDPDATDVTTIGCENWKRLQDYLNAKFEHVRLRGYEPRWVVGLETHRNLLTAEPVHRYAAAALRGDDTEFRDACALVEVSETSWIVRRLVLAQVAMAAGLPDHRFMPHVSPLLKILNEHAVVRHQGLAQLVNRYAEASVREEHRSLREATIGAWGNPLLQLNRPRWGQVTDQGRRMVANWLKLGLIQGFFEILSEDSATDHRRVKFWKRYHDQIDGMYFALGANARYSRSPDIKELRKEMGDLQLTLVRGGASANNAFIMLFGSYAVVEFGMSGNACFVFDREKLPFSLHGEIAGDRTGLKHDDRRSRLLHVDTSMGKWEKEFERVLDRLGIRAEAPREREARLSDTSKVGSQQTQTAEPEFSRKHLQELAQQYGLKIEDRRWRGGALWVLGSGPVGTAAAQLAKWGFRWADRKNGWYRSERK